MLVLERTQKGDDDDGVKMDPTWFSFNQLIYEYSYTFDESLA